MKHFSSFLLQALTLYGLGKSIRKKYELILLNFHSFFFFFFISIRSFNRNMVSHYYWLPWFGNLTCYGSCPLLTHLHSGVTRTSSQTSTDRFSIWHLLFHRFPFTKPIHIAHQNWWMWLKGTNFLELSLQVGEIPMTFLFSHITEVSYGTNVPACEVHMKWGQSCNTSLQLRMYLLRALFPASITQSNQLHLACKASSGGVVAALCRR